MCWHMGTKLSHRIPAKKKKGLSLWHTSHTGLERDNLYDRLVWQMDHAVSVSCSILTDKIRIKSPGILHHFDRQVQLSGSTKGRNSLTSETWRVSGTTPQSLLCSSNLNCYLFSDRTFYILDSEAWWRCRHAISNLRPTAQVSPNSTQRTKHKTLSACVTFPC